MKHTNNTKTPVNQQVTNPASEVNFQAKYYQEKHAAFYNSASYCEPSEPVYFEMPKSVRKAEIKSGLAAAAKVRHNGRQNNWSPSKYVMVAGVPHKMVDGVLTPLSNPVQDEMAAAINKQLHKLAGLKIVK